MVKSNGEQVRVAYAARELMEGGEIFDYVALKHFDQPICRYVFNELLSALSFIHKAGVSHRDLKPENIMLDGQFNVKIAEFGFAAPI